MNGVIIQALYYEEINAVCAVAILLFGFLTFAYMKAQKEYISRFMIVLVGLLICALTCDTIRRHIGGDFISIYDGDTKGFILIGTVSQLLAAGIWMAFVQSRTIISERIKKVSISISMTLDIAMLVFAVFSYHYAPMVIEWEERIGFEGLTVRLIDYFMMLIYIITLIYAINRISESWARKRQSFAIIAYSAPIIITYVCEIVTGRNFRSFGWMIAFVMYVFIRLVDINRGQNRELKHFLNVMDSIKDEYLCIFYVNLEKNTFETYVVSDIIKNSFSDFLKEGDYERMVQAYLDNRVYSSDADKFRSAMDRKAIVNRLGNLNSFIVEYRGYKEGELANYQMQCWKPKNEKELKHVVLGFKDISQEKQREFTNHKNNLVLRSLVEGFEYVCYIDFGNDTIEEYHVSKNFEYYFNLIGEDDITKRFDKIFEHGISSDEFAAFRERFNRDTVQEELADMGQYSVECKMNLGRGLRYYNVKALADRINPEAAIIGIVDIDDQIRREIEKEERAKEREYSIQLESTIAERTAELHEKAKSLNQINEDIIELLGNITEARDTESGEHIKRVKGFTNILAKRIMTEYPEYGLDEEKIALITSASALHDVGKIMIPDAILRKPGKFSDEEYDIMKTHCDKGCEVLKNAPKGWDESYLNFSMEICRSHHEKWDGKGYPNGLKGDEIPISAQIVAVADCFDALTTKRVYKPAFSPQQAYDMILNGECGQFSPKILDAFTKAKEEFIAQIDNGEEFRSTPALNAHSLTDINILLVEDNELTRKITTEILEEEGAKVNAVADGNAALKDIMDKENIDYDVILLDLILPDMDGWEVAKKIKAMDKPRASEVPIIAISSSGDEHIKQKAFEAGMVAFIPKPVSVSTLTKILIKSMRSEQDSLKKRLEEIVKRANNDPLTGVKNITAYTEAVGELTRKIADKEPTEFAIVMCDINHLKVINDNYGHHMGDKYIKNCSKIICKTYAHSPVYRIGGDEFAVILTGEDYARRNELIDDLGERIGKAADIDSIENGKASMAVGMSVYNPYTDFSVAGVTKRADDSMYMNKRMMEYEGNYN